MCLWNFELPLVFYLKVERYLSIILTSLWSKPQISWLSLMLSSSLTMLVLQSGWGALSLSLFFIISLLIWKSSSYLILAFCKIILIFLSIPEDFDVNTFVNKDDIILLLWLSPFRKKLSILCIIISSIGIDFRSTLIK